MEIMYGGFTQYFTRIAVDALREEIAHQEQIKLVQQDHPKKYRKLFELHHKWLSLYLTCIVFSAFALESYINGYGVRRFTAKYYKDFLDRLSLESKLVVVPRLATGKSIVGTKAHILVKKVIRARNRLAHDKPRHIKSYDKESVETVITFLDSKRDLAKEITAYEAIEAIIELKNELERIDPESVIFPLVDSYLENVWAEISTRRVLE